MTREVYLGWPVAAASTGRFDARAVRARTDGKPDFEIWQTLSAKFPFARPDAKSVASKGPRKRQTPPGKSSAVPNARGGIAAKVFATRYRIGLPNEETLRQEILETQRVIETRAAAKKALP